jgi:hypothetical protein
MLLRAQPIEGLVFDGNDLNTATGGFPQSRRHIGLQAEAVIP